MPLDPGVECRLRLFEHGDVAEARGLRRLLRQFARDRVERCRNGDENFLLGKRARRDARAPRHARRCRRYSADASTGEMRVTPSPAFQGNIAAVRSDRRIRQPAFGGRNQTAGNLRAAALREPARQSDRCRHPREAQSHPREIPSRPACRGTKAAAVPRVTSFAFVSCGMAATETPALSSSARNARALLVVPRSMPME